MYEAEIKILKKLDCANGSFHGVQNEIDKRGEKIFPGEDGGLVAYGEDAVNRIDRVANKLQEEGYPVILSVYRGEELTSARTYLVNPDNPDFEGVPLYGFNIGNTDGPYRERGLSLKTLHQRHRGARQLLIEVFAR